MWGRFRKFTITFLTIVIVFGMSFIANGFLKIHLEEIHLEEVLNYLDYNLNRPGEIGLVNFVWTLDSYDILKVNITKRSQVINYLNSLQNDEGIWDYGGMYVTSQILMFYNRSGVRPAKSLEPFFSTVDTWDKVVSIVDLYGSQNYWGYLYLIVNSYIVYKGTSPPWAKEFLDEANKKFDTWAYSNHQRTHLILNLFELRKPIPRIDKVVNITLQQQKEDGSWESSLAETVFMVGALELIRNQTSVDQILIESAISKGLAFVRNCYKRVEYEGKIYGGFATDPTMQYPWQRETALGIWALLNPTSDVWTRWFNAHVFYTFNVSWNGSNYTIISVSNSTITNFNFSYSSKQISFDVAGLPATMGFCNTSIPKTFMGCDSPTQWNVTVDGSPVDNLAVIQNSTHTFLYFTYSHSPHEVIIGVIPEFPSTFLLFLLMIITSIGVVLARAMQPPVRKLLHKSYLESK